MFQRTKLATAVVAACGGVMLSTGAIAQTQPAASGQQLERVTVTGSNIRRVDTETASPVQVISRDEIERTGKATIAEYLQTLTVDGAGSIPKTFGNGFAGGGSGVSLRGLGAGSTLVLLNGRRMASFGLADDGQKVFTDLSTIPMEAVERVEVLKDGASAVYGSDAIAGVVNIILRREFNGIVAKGSYGVSGYGDGDTKKAALTAGFGNLANDRYNVFVNAEVNKTNAIAVKDRADRKWIGNGDLRPYGYSRGGSQFLTGAITGGGAAAQNSPLGSIQNPTTGLWESLPGSCSQFTSVSQADSGGGCLWEAGQFRDLTPEEESFNLFGRGTLVISESLEAYAEVGFSRKKTEFHNTPSGVSGAWGYPGGPVNASAGPGATVIGADHPDNPYGVETRLRYSAFDVGPRITNGTNDFTRVLVGLKGAVAGWEFDTAVLHSETDLLNERRGFLRYSAVRAALTDPINPWRIGANAGLNSPDIYSRISPTIHADAKSSLDMIDVKASRELMDLPGGALSLALGAEYRRVKNSLTPQTFTDQGDIIGLGFSAYDGKQEVAGAYAELLAPIVKQVELSAAFRADKYKGGETATTPKVGVKWTPLQQVAVRGTYAEGFRAPNPAENGKGGLAAFTNAVDPVRCAIDPVNECDAAQVAIITAPNSALKPEESKSYTLGLVLEPTTSTTVTFDLWQIKRSNEINQETIQAAIAKGNVLRSDNLLNGIPGTGTLLAANASYINSAQTTVRGWDLDMRQRFNLAEAGRLTLDLQWSRMNTFEREEADGSKLTFVGTHGNCDTTNCIGTPKNRINFGTTWDSGPFSVSGVVNYIGSFANKFEAEDETCASAFADGSDAPGGCKIPSFTTFNLSGRWRPTKSLEIFGSIENVFDRVAPIDPLTYGAVNYNPLHSSGAIGRFFTLGVKYAFN
jgi:iron complex outermembrane receptor protein